MLAKLIDILVVRSHPLMDSASRILHIEIAAPEPQCLEITLVIPGPGRTFGKSGGALDRPH